MTVTTDVARPTVGVLTGAPATDAHSGAGARAALESGAQKRGLALAAVIVLDDASAASTARGMETLRERVCLHDAGTVVTVGAPAAAVRAFARDAGLSLVTVPSTDPQIVVSEPVETIECDLQYGRSWRVDVLQFRLGAETIAVRMGGRLLAVMHRDDYTAWVRRNPTGPAFKVQALTWTSDGHQVFVSVEDSVAYRVADSVVARLLAVA